MRSQFKLVANVTKEQRRIEDLFEESLDKWERGEGETITELEKTTRIEAARKIRQAKKTNATELDLNYLGAADAAKCHHVHQHKLRVK